MAILTTSFISIGTWLGLKIADKGFDSIAKKVTSSDKINTKFYKCVELVAARLEKKYPTVLGGGIDYFFKREEVLSELMKILFRDSKISIAQISKNFDTDTLPANFIKEFIKNLKSELLKDQEFDEILSNKELYITIQGIGKDAELIANTSTITANEIIRISKLLDERLGKSFSYNDFYNIYKNNALNNLQQINFLGLGIDISIKKKRKNLQDIFIKPFFKSNEKKVGIKTDNSELYYYHDNSQLIKYEKVLEATKLVILGNPGSGKSLLVKAIMCDILEERPWVPDCAVGSLPFRIELRKYLASKKENKGNILKYLVSVLEEEFQVHSMTETILDHILKEQKCYIFFDGLDEIFNIEDKIDTKNDIENFDTTYPKLNTIVTSRIIGYEEARLEQKRFSEMIIQNFNDQQVEEYVRKWYDKEEEIVEVRDREIKGFLEKKNEIDSELIKNPLLLSLIVIIYRNILKLPESKLEIYQSCTKTLVDKWDASKELVINLDTTVLKNKDKLFGDLAYWQYELLSGNSTKITYERAKKTVSRSIQEKLKIVDDFIVNELADSFMEYAQKRSIYFDNNFTHKTFLEYYTAYWIYSNIEKKHDIAERDRIFEKYVNNPFWFIVLELLLNLIDKDQEDTDIIDGIITKQAERTNESLPFLLATLPSLKNISEERIKYCINKAIEFLYTVYSTQNDLPNTEKLETKIFTALQKLFSSHSTFRLIIINALKEEEIKSDRLEKVYTLYLELIVFRNDINRKFELGNEGLYDEYLRKDPYLFIMDTYMLNYREKAKNYYEKIVSFLKNFDSKFLFINYRARYATYIIGEFFFSYLSTQLEPRNISSLSANLKNLSSHGLKVSHLHNFKSGHRLSDNKEKTIEVIMKQYFLEENREIKTLLAPLIISVIKNTGNNKVIAGMIENIPNDRSGNDLRKMIMKELKTKPGTAVLSTT